MPAVVYGPKQTPITISVDEQVFDKLRKAVGESTIINLTGLDQEVEVLIKHIEFNPAKVEISHADFYAIERGKDMHVTVPIEFIGEAPVEKSNLGSVNKVLHEIEVICRPSNMPAHITVDVSVLVDVTDKITVSDLENLEGVSYNADAEDPVAVVSAARTEAVETEDAAPVDIDAVVTEGEKKPEA
jgi:large subunit ribosomal protein L25